MYSTRSSIQVSQQEKIVASFETRSREISVFAASIVGNALNVAVQASLARRYATEHLWLVGYLLDQEYGKIDEYQIILRVSRLVKKIRCIASRW